GLGPLISSVYLWEQPEEVSPGPLLSLEEQILNSTFEACDPQRTGTVAVTHVLAYLEAVTGQGPQDTRLQTLARSLDPKGKGPGATVDLDTFLVVMRDWIAACQLHGPATADLLSSLEDLELSNRRLAGENAKLQRSVETAEEGSARLTEEILALRRQLRSSQQALQFAKAVDEELEDLKSLAKSLEEKNRRLLAQARQTEKEQQHLVAEVETLQEENGKLLAERDGVKRRNEELATEKDALKRTRHTESLAKTLEEYRMTTQELRREISHLEEQLNQTSGGPEELLEGAQARRVGWTTLLPTSLGLEIEAICQKQEMAGSELSSPLCGVWQWEEVISEPHEETEFPSEVPTGAQSNSEGEPAHLEEGTKVPSRGSSAEPELQQALVPVVKELVPARRPWGQCCLHSRHCQRLRVTQHPLVPAPILGLLLLLLLSVLLLGQSPTPTWPHLQLCYLQPPPV
ncbi:Protein KASH5, partial [Sciurus carolinensis]|nr:Protein KASH5 [Sciurus carolinensis]